jgi:hypothetical protein
MYGTLSAKGKAFKMKDLIMSGVYQHFKGGLYEVTGTSLEVSDEEAKMNVDYRDFYNTDKKYSREFSKFLGDHPKYKCERFEYVGHIVLTVRGQRIFSRTRTETNTAIYRKWLAENKAE